ncbi:hypothetical protein ACHAXN_011771 [Cyclotella atomus]
MSQEDGKHIRANAEQLLQRVAKREQLLSLSPCGSTNKFLTPQQQEELRKLSIKHDKDERRNTEESLRRHGYVPKVQRRRVVVDGKVYVEEIEGESDADDCSFVSCLEEEGQIANQSHVSATTSQEHDSSCKSKEEWVHLQESIGNDDDGDWEPLVPQGIDEQEQPLDSPADSKNDSGTQSEAPKNELVPINQSNITNQEIVEHNKTDEKQDDNNPLLWIGGGLAVVGAVAGIAFANIKKKEHFEKKSKRSGESS